MAGYLCAGPLLALVSILLNYSEGSLCDKRSVPSKASAIFVVLVTTALQFDDESGDFAHFYLPLTELYHGASCSSRAHGLGRCEDFYSHDEHPFAARLPRFDHKPALIDQKHCP